MSQRSFRQPIGLMPLTVACVVSLSGVALGQDAGQMPGDRPAVLTGEAKREFDANAQLLSDFIHFTRINRPDVAAGVGTQLLGRNLRAVDFVDLVERSGEQQRFEETVARAMRSPQLEPTAAALLRLYDQGKLQRVRDPKEIARNIELLKGVQRGRMLARERLAAAGEYAMPQLLETLLKLDPELRAEVTRLMIDMGQQSVTPLATALGQLDAANQETVADILGLIGYRTALPYLVDVMGTTTSPSVRAAADRAIRRIGLQGAADAASLYAELAEGYYQARSELTSFPNDEFQLLWSYNPASGLNMTAIRTPVYHEAMAMRLAERSLELRPQGNDRALSLWLAANFSREIDTPPNYENPAYAATRRDAMYYAVAAGSGPSQQVLARALDRREARLARRAIAAIEQTASGPALFASGGPLGERRPLVEALTFPSRRVQYDAALALGRANPTASFAGSERVVPMLASAIRDAGARFAVVVSPNRELGDLIRRTLERDGYTVLPVASSLAELAGPIADAPGIDLIVASLEPDPVVGLVNEVRTSATMRATPVLAVTDAQGAIDLGRKYDRDATVAVRPRGISEAQISASAAQLVEAATGGPISAEEAQQYAARSLAVLRDLAVAQNPVLNPGDAALPLISAMADARGVQRLAIADVLSRINQKRAQVAIMDAALNASGPERLSMLAQVAESAKRFGNLLEPSQVQRAVELAASATGAEATAAAALVGSLNLETNNIVPLILEKR